MNKFKTIRNKILIILLPLFIVSMIILTLTGYYNSKRVIESEVKTKMTNQMNALIGTIDEKLNVHGTIIEAVKNFIEVNEGKLENDEFKELLKKVLPQNKDTSGMGIWYEPYKYTNDKELFSPFAYKKNNNIEYTNEYGNSNYVTEEWYKIGINSEGTIGWSSPYVDSLTKESMITAVAPLQINGANIGIVSGDVNLSSIQEMISNLKIGDTGHAFLLDTKGTYLATNDKEKIMSLNITEENNETLSKIGKEILENKNGVGTYEKDKNKHNVYYDKIPGTNWILGLDISQKELYSPLNTLIRNNVITAIISIIVISMIITLLAKKLSFSIDKVNKFSNLIADGVLTENLDIKSDDEIGQMCKSLNTMNNTLRDIVTNVSSSLEQVVASSEELTATASETKEAAFCINKSIEEVTQGNERQLKSSVNVRTECNKLNLSIKTVCDKVEEATNVSQIAHDSANKGTKVISETIKHMNNIDNTVSESGELVNALGEKSKEIGNIISVITNISDQTNLLALNAAIESARAGEAGKGFSVVAGEVSKLADETSRAANNISKLIKDIQNLIEKSVSGMNSEKKAVQEGITLANSAGESFKEILNHIINVVSFMNGVNKLLSESVHSTQIMTKSVEQSEKISKEVNEHTEKVLVSSEEQTVFMEEVSKACEDLSKMAVKLQETLTKFKM